MATSLLSQLVNLFVAPSKTFEGVKEAPKWLLPLTLCIFVSFTYQALTSKYKMEDLKSRIRSNEQLSPNEIQRRIANVEEQRSHGISIRQLTRALGFVGAIQVIKAFGLALALWLALQLTASKIRFRAVLSISTLSLLIQVPEVLIKTPLSFYKQTTNLMIGPAVLLPPEWQGSMLFNLLDGFDIFSCWTFVVLSIGVYVVAQISRKVAFSTVGLLWAIWLIGRIMFGSIVQIT